VRVCAAFRGHGIGTVAALAAADRLLPGHAQHLMHVRTA